MAVLTINRGLVTSPNELTRPDGAATVLDNCNIDFDNVVEPRRGFGEFGNQTESDAVVKQLLTYKGRILRHFNDKLSFDSTGNGSFLNFSGSYNELISRLRIKYFELNSNLYFTTNEGIKKISAKTADDFTTSPNYITNAGGVKALSLEARIDPSASGFLPAQSKVAYKVLWARKDANGNVIRGVPSSRTVVTNTSRDINKGEEFVITVTDAGAGEHHTFDSTSDISDGIQTTFLAAAVNVSANTIALTSGSTDHNFQTNDRIKLLTGTYTLPTGLSAGNYYVIRVDTNRIKLKTTIEGSEVDITAAGTGGIVESTNVGRTITITSHGYNDNDKVRLFGDIADELNSSTIYYVVNSTANTFQLATVESGTPLVLTKKEGKSNIYSGISSLNYITFDSPTNKYALWFNISGQDNAPTNAGLVGRTFIEVNISTLPIKTKENYSAKIAQSLFGVSDIEVTVDLNEITVINRDGGNVLNASRDLDSAEYLQVSTAIDGQTATGTPANVIITFPVPAEINSKDFFYEVYRTAVISIQTGLTLNDLDPGEEFQKVYEAPVSENGVIPVEMSFEDLLSESFRESGAFLYTNPISGEGILQSNDAPPIAHDVAIFKGSAFYANTKERHRLQFNLLGVKQFQSGISKIYVGNSSVVRSYTFVGVNQVLEFTAKKKTETVGGSYFDINSARNLVEYRVWFDKGTITHLFDENDIDIINDVINIPNHGFTTNDKVEISGTSLPVGLSAGTYYIIKEDADNFKLKSEVAGTAIDLSLVSYSFNETDVSESNDTITIVDHGFETNDKVEISGASLPAGLTAGIYYIIKEDDDTFKLKTDILGLAIDLSSAVGTATLNKIVSTTISHTSTQPAQDSKLLLRVVLENAEDTIQASVDAFIEAFFDIIDFNLTDKGSGVIEVSYVDNGAVNDVTQSTIVTNWDNPVKIVEGLGENAANNEVLLSGLLSDSLSIEDTAKSLERVINKDPLSPVNAFYISGINDAPGILVLEARSIIDDPFYLGFSEETVTPVFEPSLPVVRTITSVAPSTPEAVFTTSTDHGFIVGQQVYTFVKTDTELLVTSGNKIVSNIYSPSTTTFSLSGVTSPAYSSFEEAIVFPSDVVSDNSVNANRVYFSKIQQPEAVPLVNYIDIGPKDKAIQRIMALRDSLVVLKEDGVYIITGSAAPNFSVRLSDSSALTYAPDTATNLNNLIYVLTSQGVVTVSETGVGVISRNIENKIQEVANSKFNYKLMSWGMASESDRCYLIWLPEKTNDTYATQAYRYNTFTRTWTRWTKPANCGVVNPTDDKIYLGDASGRPYVLQERKNYERQDYADREIIRTIAANSISGTTITLSSVVDLAKGDVLTQKQYVDINKFNRLLKRLDRDAFASGYISLKAFTGDNLGLKLIELSAKLNADGIPVITPSGSNNVDDLRADFNDIVAGLNAADSGTNFKGYKEANDLLVYEVLITGVDFRNNSVQIKYTNKFIQGDVSIFKGINCLVEYAPQHFGKPEATKQVSEGTFIFDQNNFWGGTIAYSSDRSFDFKAIEFSGRGPGFWDGYSWANATFGGEGNEVPVRTLIPRDKARCRYLHVQFIHINAREQWKLIGVSLEPREVSTRGYR